STRVISSCSCSCSMALRIRLRGTVCCGLLAARPAPATRNHAKTSPYCALYIPYHYEQSHNRPHNKVHYADYQNQRRPVRRPENTMTAASTAPKAAPRTQSLQRAVALLRIIAFNNRSGSRLVELYRRTGLERPTVH